MAEDRPAVQMTTVVGEGRDLRSSAGDVALRPCGVEHQPLARRQLDGATIRSTAALVPTCCWSLTTFSSEATSMTDATSIDPDRGRGGAAGVAHCLLVDSPRPGTLRPLRPFALRFPLTTPLRDPNRPEALLFWTTGTSTFWCSVAGCRSGSLTTASVLHRPAAVTKSSRWSRPAHRVATAGRRSDAPRCQASACQPPAALLVAALKSVSPYADHTDEPLRWIVDNAESAGAVTLTNLVRQALRMRPDRLVGRERNRNQTPHL
jgi:hypothetical protein